MEESMLKTSWRQRVIIIVIAAILLLSSIAVYIAVVLSGSLSGKSGSSELDAIADEYVAKQKEIVAALPSEHLDQLKTYKSYVTAYNENTANSEGLQYKDLLVGEGTEISGDFNNYYAYYIGFCADETVFDSSFDDFANPTSLQSPLDVASMSLIEGWTQGMLGAKVGGVRELTIPGELAYANNMEICGGYNKPIKFIVMTVDLPENVQKLFTELQEIDARYMEASYQEYMKASTDETTTEITE